MKNKVKANYTEIINYDNNAIKEFFDDVVKKSHETFKSKKLPDTTKDNTSCAFF